MLGILLIRLRNNPLALQIEEGESQGKGISDTVPVIQEKEASSNDSSRVDEDIIETDLFRSLENGRGPNPSFPEFHGHNDVGVFREDRIQDFRAGWNRNIPEDVEAYGSRFLLDEESQRLGREFRL